MQKLIRSAALVALALVAGAWTAFADSGNDEKDAKDEKKAETITLADLPAAVRATIDKEIPGAKIEKIEKEEDKGKVLYDIEAEFKDEDVEMDIAADGKVLTREDSVEFSTLPAVIRAAAEKYFGKSSDLEAHKEVEFEKKETFYEIEGKKDGHKVTLKYAEDGKQVEEEKE